MAPRPRKPTRRWASHVHLEDGALKGWCSKCPATRRHSAIRSAVRADGYATAVRRLNFLRNVASRKSNPRLRETARRDLNWTQRHLADT